MLNEAGVSSRVLLIVLPVQREPFAEAAARADWRCLEIGPGGVWPSASMPSLIVAEVEHVGSLAHLRDTWAPGAGLATVGDDVPGCADDAVPPDAPASAHDALLARWRPLPLSDAVERQVAVFGRDALLPLVARLRARLIAIVSADAPVAREAAHQLAGIAGILGFAEVGTAWELVSHIGESQLGDARRETRRAIAAIDRSGLCAPQP